MDQTFSSEQTVKKSMFTLILWYVNFIVFMVTQSSNILCGNIL